MLNIRRFPFYIVFSLLLYACGDKITLQPPPNRAEEQFAYFPLQTGKYVVYTVDSIVFDVVSGTTITRDSSRTFVKLLVGDTLRDNNGALVYQIERYERPNTQSDWQLTHIGSAARNNSQAIWTEQNLRYLSLVFPMDKRSSWNGLIWIDTDRELVFAKGRMRPFSNWRYEVDSIDIPSVINNFQLDSVLVVTEADDDNIIEKRFSRARYAKHIGLVQREQWILDSQYCNQVPAPTDCNTKPWIDKAENGYILRQTMIETNYE